MKIVVFGNSVSLRIRPYNKGDQAYPFLLQEELHYANVSVEALGGAMIDSLLANTDKVYCLNPDVIILNFGIVELCSRSVGRGCYNYLNYYIPRNKWRRVIQKLFQFIESKFRTTLVVLRGFQPWYNPDCFIKDYESLIREIDEKSKIKIIVIGISYPNKRVDNQLPKSLKRVIRTNTILRKNLEALDLIFIDPNDLTTSKNRPDGIHFNNEGHKLIAKEIIRNINSERSFQKMEL